MKKLLLFSMAAVLVLAIALPASAFESVFGGYWRTRAVIREDFDGDDNAIENRDIKKIDTRTRLYYTAILNDNLKFVNKFEFDTAWGKNNGAGNLGGLNRYGDFGADGQNVEIKESYVDFNVAPLAFKVGVHNFTLGRGFIFDDEAAGIDVRFKNDLGTFPAVWFRGWEGGDGTNSDDLDIWGLNPVFNVGESFTLNPYAVLMYSDDASTAVAAGNASSTGLPATADEVKVFYVGVNVDGTIGPASVFGTAIYQGGTVDNAAVGGDDWDVAAFVLLAGGSIPLGPANLHGQAFYASGDDDPADDDLEAFFGIGGGGAGQAYYWSEIMGLGMFDWDTPTGAPGADITNIVAANIGATIKPMEKLSLTGDLWYAALVEDDAFGNDELGIEIDLVATYQLVEGMNLDLVAAYLFADDAISAQGDNREDPYELGWRLSLSF